MFQPNPDIPEKPYIIGLTGGIASGKTNIAKHLETLGAGVVDCDQIGHHIYKVGSPGHSKVVECFGEGVLDDSGAIDRVKLGAIVFSDKVTTILFLKYSHFVSLQSTFSLY